MFVSDFWKVGTSVSFTNKTELHHIAEILLKVTLSKHLCYILKLHPDIQFLLYSTQLDMLSVKLRPMLNIICKMGYSISYLQTCLTYVHYSLFNHEGSSVVLFSPANILSQYSRVMILVLNYWEMCHAKNIGLLRNCVTICFIKISSYWEIPHAKKTVLFLDWWETMLLFLYFRWK